MKQCERKAIALGDNAAVLFECSSNPTVPIPRLTIFIGQFAEDGNVFPPTSAIVYGESVRDLYKMLHEYYTNKQITGKNDPVGVAAPGKS